MKIGVVFGSTLLLLVALCGLGEGLDCNGRPCVGPIQVTWSGLNCNGTISMVVELSPGGGTAGACVNTTVLDASSSKFSCNSEMVELISYAGTETCEAGYYHVKITSPIARCVNLDAFSGTPTSYVYLCSASDFDTTTIAPSFSGQPNGVAPHFPLNPCPSSGCTPGIASQKRYDTSQCSGPFSNVEKSFGNMDECIMGLGGSSMKYSCGPDYLRFYNYPYGCNQPYTEVAEESRHVSHCLLSNNFYYGEISCSPVITLPAISFQPSTSGPAPGVPSSNASSHPLPFLLFFLCLVINFL